MLLLLANLSWSQVISVDNTSGTGRITVPLTSVQNGPLSVSLSLGYNAAGIPVAMGDGTFGLGWQLNAVGGISRTVNGLPDDYYGRTTEDKRKGWLYSDRRTEIPNFIAGPSGTGQAHENDVFQALDSLGYVLDTEPDIFTVNLPTVYCQFVFDNDGDIQLLSAQEVVIEPTIDSTLTTWDNTLISTNLGGFTITDSNGIKYYLSVGSTANIQYTDADTRHNNDLINERELRYYDQPTTFTTSWVVNQIRSIGGNKIKFKYETLGFDNKPYSAPKLGDINIYSNDFYRIFRNGIREDLYTLSSNYTAKKLKCIVSAQDSITLSYTDREDEKGQKIAKINKYRGGEKLLELNFTYLLADSRNTTQNLAVPQKRLFLSSVQSTAFARRTAFNSTSESIANEPLKFNYYGLENVSTTEEDAYETSFPSMDSYQYDYWGYYNGSGDERPYTQLYIYPGLSSYNKYRNHPLPASAYTGEEIILEGNDRRMNFAAALAGSIKSVITSQGATHHLQYEPNQFTDSISGTLINGGGLRIAKWITYDGLDSNNDIVREYNYYNSGVLLYMPAYYIPTAVDSITTVDEKTGDEIYTHFLLQADRNMAPGGGNNVRYTRSGVSKPGFGHTEFFYNIPVKYGTQSVTNEWAATELKVARANSPAGSYQLGLYSTGSYAYPFWANPPFEKQGQLLEEHNYDEQGNLVTKTEYLYQDWQKTREKEIYSLSFEPVLTYAGTGSGKVVDHSYLYSKNIIPVNRVTLPYQTISIQYIPGTGNSNTQSSTVLFGTKHLRPIESSITDAGGTRRYTKSSYAFDYAADSSADASTNAIWQLQKNNQNWLVEQVSEIQLPGQNKTVTGAGLTTYAQLDSLVYLAKSYALSGPQPDFAPAAIAGTTNPSFSYSPNYKLVNEVVQISEQGRVLTTQGRSKTALTTLYDKPSGRPVFEASYAKASEIIYDNFDSGNDRGCTYYQTSYVRGSFNTSIAHTGTRSLNMNNLLDEESNCRGLFQPENANYNLSFWHLGGTETPASVQVKIQILSSDFAQVLEQQTHTMQPQSNEWKRFVRKLDLGNYLGQEVGIRVSSVDQFYLDDFLLIPTKAHYSHSGYNRKGQLTSVTDSEGDSERYYYDALGRLITTKDNNGNILTHTEYSR